MIPESIYGRRLSAYERLQAKQRRTANRLSNYRFFTVLIGLTLAVLIYRAASPALGLAIGLLTVILFGFLAFRHDRVLRRLRYAETLGDLNRKGIERVTGRWGSFADTGAEFKDDEHPYASDLDLFGQASLFQWINSAQTPLGRETLAKVVKQAPEAPLEIAARQEAVAELARKLAWRQRFEAEGLLVRAGLEPTAPLVQWAERPNQGYLQPLVKLGIWVLPAVTILMVGVYVALPAIPWQAPALLAAAQVLLLRVYGKERAQLLSTVHRFEASLSTYSRMLALFEQQRFDAKWLRVRQARLRSAAGGSAYAQIKRLSAIADRISNRGNAMFMIVNILTLWDYHCMVALETWKEESGKRLGTWLEVLAEIEALSSLANIRFDHPDWAMPTVAEAGGLSAEQIGHPLITRGRVANDFEMRAPSRIFVITGSNMSGKSTFLRTVGISLVLAYVGAPVCASSFRCSVMSLWTSMRVSDNLGQSLSSFYAELLRIKRVVEAAKKEQVCFLLDEIFKGTNSHDRHQGATALIAQLQRDGAYGLVSTHDLELGELEGESDGRIKNYHFREFYEGREIRFDYTLRAGVSTTRNALYLIKMVGIEI